MLWHKRLIQESQKITKKGKGGGNPLAKRPSISRAVARGEAKLAVGEHSGEERTR